MQKCWLSWVPVEVKKEEDMFHAVETWEEELNETKDGPKPQAKEIW